MQKIKYIPKSCQPNTETGEKTFSGHVVIQKPNIFEYFDYTEKYSEQFAELSTIEQEDDPYKRLKKIRPMLDFLKDAKHLLTEIQIKNEKTGAEYKLFDELTSDMDCLEIVLDVASQILVLGAPPKK